MMENITIGQFIPGDSWIYKIDPRIKILATIIFMVALFLLPTLNLLLIGAGLFVLLYISTGLSLIKLIKGLSGLLMLLIFTFIIQIIYNKEGVRLVNIEFNLGLYSLISIGIILLIYMLTRKKVIHKTYYFIFMLILAFVAQALISYGQIYSSYSLEIYEGGLERALFVFLRVIVMIGITSLLTFTTMSTEINNGLAFILYPLKFIKVPVGTISMMFSLTLRFVPTLLDETRKIMKAQASRGIDFQTGRLKDRITQIVSLLIPMFVISIKRAEDLADAMEARGYVIDAPRTKLDELKLRYYDYISLVIVVGSLVGAIVLNVVY